ncbi:MAG: SGNH/GDSL hydrolase family protein [Bacteroidales bacterium]|nr:SGNH/GDSL hydrolase family protein [Bacteroidales bacterium]
MHRISGGEVDASRTVLTTSCSHIAYTLFDTIRTMNYSILSSMIQTVIIGAKKAKIISRGGATSTDTERSAHPKTHILRIGIHVDRHNRWLDRRLKEVKDGDLVVLEYGGNYCNFDWAAISANPDADHLPLLSFGQFREFYGNAITKCQAIGARVALLTLPTLLPQRYFDLVSRNLNRDNLRQWIGGDVCSLSRWNEQYNEEILSLAAQYQVPVIDINPSFLQHHYLEDCYSDDGMRPNSTGHTVIAELVADWERRH